LGRAQSASINAVAASPELSLKACACRPIAQDDHANMFMNLKRSPYRRLTRTEVQFFYEHIVLAYVSRVERRPDVN